MKNLIVSITLSLLFISPVAISSSSIYAYQQKPDKIEIKHKEIPEEARLDIIDKFHGAEILKAYKEVIDGEIVGYQVELEKGPKKWVVIYDKNGSPKNKVVPNQ